MYLDSMPCDLRWQPDFDGLFRGFLAVMTISSSKMAATARKADCHLRLVPIKLRKNVCESLWTKCASISNYLIHVMLSYDHHVLTCITSVLINRLNGSDSKKSRLSLTVSANQAPQKCMLIPMDKMCKHQQLFDSRDAVLRSPRAHLYYKCADKQIEL